MPLPPYPNNINKQGRMIDIDGKHMAITILDEIRRPQSDYPSKLIILQKIQFNESKVIQFRLAYYIIGKKPAMAGKWVFGQFATLMPEEDFKYIVDEAKRKGWLAP